MKNMCGIDFQIGAGYRAPLGRGKLCVAYPGRCPGLRDVGPLGRGRSANGAEFLSPAQRAGYALPHFSMRPERPRYDVGLAHRPPGEILKALGQLEAEIQQGMKELEGMLK